jgi:DNA-directed RNA polymerase specialized sigma24 family protein
VELALDPPPRRSSSAVVDALNREWAVTVTAASTEFCASVEAARCGDDAALHALVAAACSGDRLAGRAVLQSQLGRLVRLARRDPRATVDDYVSAFWCVLARYPLARRPVRIAANLALDTLKLVHADRRWMGRSPASVQPVGDDLEPLLDRLRVPPEEPEPGAADLIRAGQQLRLLDAPTSRLLHAVYVDGLDGREAAARCATTPGSLRVRCSRAVHRLAAHAAELAEAA